MSDTNRTEPSALDRLGEMPEPWAWTLKGSGMYGSDVEVVSLDAYRRLAQRCENAEAAALMWGRKCSELEGRTAAQDFDEARLLDIVRALRLPYRALREALSKETSDQRPATEDGMSDPWSEPTDGAVTKYGFRWGPMLVTRLAHVTKRGYVLSIETPRQTMQVYVSEKGRKIESMPVHDVVRDA